MVEEFDSDCSKFERVSDFHSKTFGGPTDNLDIDDWGTCMEGPRTAIPLKKME
jgi:hypothetical protein